MQVLTSLLLAPPRPPFLFFSTFCFISCVSNFYALSPILVHFPCPFPPTHPYPTPLFSPTPRSFKDMLGRCKSRLAAGQGFCSSSARQVVLPCWWAGSQRNVPGLILKFFFGRNPISFISPVSQSDFKNCNTYFAACLCLLLDEVP